MPRSPASSLARALSLLAVGSAIVSSAISNSWSADRRPDYSPAAYAIRGAKLVIGTGATIENGSVVVRKGMIEAVGPDSAVTIPVDARIIEGKGLVVYPGFIDAYTSLGQSIGGSRSKTGDGRSPVFSDYAYVSMPSDDRRGMTPEYDSGETLELTESLAESRRALGFTAMVSAPTGPIAAGTSVVAATSGLPRRETILRSPHALQIELGIPRDPQPANALPGTAFRRSHSSGLSPYPVSLMGAISHLRQAMIDAEHHAALLERYTGKRGPRPPVDPALETLHSARSGKLPVWWMADSRDEIHRALDLSEEFGTTAVIVGGREASKVADRLKSKGVPVVLRLDFPEEPKAVDGETYQKRSEAEKDESLRALQDRTPKWTERAGTAAALHRAGVAFAFSSDRVGGSGFHEQVRKLISKGLPVDAAIRALSRDAAEIIGLGTSLGTIEVGKEGRLVVMTGPYEVESSKPRWIMADGTAFDLEEEARAASKKKSDSKKDEGTGKKSSESEPKKTSKGSSEAEKSKPSETSKKEVDPSEKKSEPNPGDPKKKEESPKAEPREPFVDIATELDVDRRPSIRTGGNVLIKNATILTVTKGTIPRGSISIRDGKIVAIGTPEKPLEIETKPPAGLTVIDAGGLVAMPGIIDPHSHMAIQGGLNEASVSIVAEVRVGDVVSGSDPGLYRALAGGTTTARLLHGSANTIGGQDAVIKLRFDRPARELIDRRGPRGVKFALGENVTRSTGRFPNTRMGVESVIERAFLEGRSYKKLWAEFAEGKAAGKDVVAPRRDLRLEALSNIVDGSIRIHSHCYRNDEILMLLRLAERHGLRVQSLQHVLEGYKVAPEIAAHGVIASTFSDWWAYKIEAFDAIPGNAGLLTDAGATVSLNSDSSEVVRHLYLEAAKMVKYGALTEEQALSLITINPAREIGLDQWIGSLEVGKDGDVALFNGHPLDGFSRCEMTLVGGEVEFQRSKSDPLKARPGDHAKMPARDPKRASLPFEMKIDPAGRYAIVGAVVHPVSRPEINRGVVIIERGKIVAVGDEKTAIPSGATRIDASGLHLWPGLINAGTPVGLFEIGSIRETQDVEDSARFQPELKAETALHPDSELIPVTRANGITNTLVIPKGGVIAGQAVVTQLDGWLPPEMVVEGSAALVINIPSHSPRDPDAPSRRGGSGDTEAPNPSDERDKTLRAIEEQFRLALEYGRVVEAARSAKAAPPATDPRMSALLPFARGEKMVIFSANRRLEILDALALTKKLKLKAAISGGQDAWRVLGELKSSGVPVFVGGTLYNPTRATDPYDAPYSLPAKLAAAGIPFAIRSAEEGADEAMLARNLPYEAATAVAYGLSEQQAVEAVTIAPARILGVADRLGSIDPGKTANLVLTTGHILQPTSVVKGLLIAGNPLPPDSRHTRLYEKFRERIRRVKEGKAPLGLVRPLPPPTID
ncbi:MAG: amidohydrolase family protein [Isosphaeraceae bacterium]|nr:amidohydrolase family protein [Isosphaeraceae bacterium]